MTSISNDVGGSKQTWMKLRLIWTALFAAQFLYGVALWFALSQRAGEPSEGDPIVKIFPVLALMSLAIAWKFPTKTLANTIRKLKQTGPLNLDPVLPPSLLQALTVASVIRFALIESVVLYGFVVALKSSEFKYFLPYLGAGVIAMLLSFPGESRFKVWASTVN